MTSYSFTEKKRIRKDFGKQRSILEVPFLLAIQVDSYREFLQESLEHSNTSVDDKPTSPQTGYEMGIGSVAAAAVLCGGIAVATGKKIRD